MLPRWNVPRPIASPSPLVHRYPQKQQRTDFARFSALRAILVVGLADRTDRIQRIPIRG